MLYKQTIMIISEIENESFLSESQLTENPDEPPVWRTMVSLSKKNWGLQKIEKYNGQIFVKISFVTASFVPV